MARLIDGRRVRDPEAELDEEDDAVAEPIPKPDTVAIAALSPSAAEQRLSEAAEEAIALANWRTKLEGLVNDLRAQIDAAAPRLRNRFEQSALDDLHDAVSQLHSGTRKMEGVSTSIPFTFAGKPGLDATRQSLLALGEEMKALQSHLERWPTEETVRDFMFTGFGGGTAIFQEQILESGQVVQLTRTQFYSWRDRFEPVVKKRKEKQESESS